MRLTQVFDRFHPDAIFHAAAQATGRYFMTIPEAVQLVLQAGALGKSGELFALDMGEPVKIMDLAHDLIRLSGLEEGVDVDITYSGVRPRQLGRAAHSVARARARLPCAAPAAARRGFRQARGCRLRRAQAASGVTALSRRPERPEGTKNGNCFQGGSAEGSFRRAPFGCFAVFVPLVLLRSS